MSTESRTLEGEVRRALACRASDLHLEPGMPVAVRVNGEIQLKGSALSAAMLLAWGRELIGEREWPGFRERGSYDLSAYLAGIRCRLNLFRTHRGLAIAVRLLSSVAPTLSGLNLHPDLASLALEPRGLVLVSGPTGSGKSSTIAALVHEINSKRSCHVLTIEHPIEFLYRPRRAFVRQREVGRDTPSFAQALRDALREDPDVIVVGELRDPEAMQLALEAAETGHLVLSTMHAGTAPEVLQRLVTAMPPEMQSNARGQLAEVLRAVVCQRLVFRQDLGVRIPELELLRASTAVEHLIRQGFYFKIPQIMEAGQRDGQWTVERYREWMGRHQDWVINEATETVGRGDGSALAAAGTGFDGVGWAEPSGSSLGLAEADDLVDSAADAADTSADVLAVDPPASADDVIVIDPPAAGSLSDLISELEDPDDGSR